MFGDIYPTKYMGKSTDTFRRMKFWLTQILPFYAKTYAVSRDSKIELLMLVSDIIVISRLKILKWNPWNVLTRMCRRKKEINDVSYTSSGRDNQIATYQKA